MLEMRAVPSDLCCSCMRFTSCLSQISQGFNLGCSGCSRTHASCRRISGPELRRSLSSQPGCSLDACVWKDAAEPGQPGMQGPCWEVALHSWGSRGQRSEMGGSERRVWTERLKHNTQPEQRTGMGMEGFGEESKSCK